MALTCGAIGMLVAVFPAAWVNLFSKDPEVLRAGVVYLRTVAPIYALSGLGMALYFAMQGVGEVLPAVGANALRLLVSAGGGLAAVWFFDAGILGFSLAIAAGFSAYGLGRPGGLSVGAAGTCPDVPGRAMPAGDKLEAKGTFKVAKGTKGIASVTLAGKSGATARFEIK
ncbi:MAG: hypothetical protein H0X13_08010 [Ramlibacter sp.]|nr:hypothetical protein [Ramlibacter sp.]